MMRISFFLFFLIPCLPILVGQEVQVVDAATKEAILDVQVYTELKDRAVLTDEQGRADISSLFPCDSLYFRHTSYVLKTLAVSTEKSQVLHIELHADAYQFEAFKIVTAREALIDVPKKVSVLSVGEITSYEARTTADLLESTGEVFVQRSQVGGGSPILRGFEANRILLMVDGVRLNNAIYRSGHLQNAISIDPFILESTEVQFGPGSLIYGSDALGGVIHFKSKKPLFLRESSSSEKLQAAQRFTSATEENTTHFDLMLSGKCVAWLGSVTRAKFNKVRTGTLRSHGDDNWGLVPYYVDQVGGVDSMFINPDPSIIPNSGYSQYDIAQKLRVGISDSLEFTLNLQYSTTSDVPRSDQLAEMRQGVLRYGEWSYGPQERYLAAASVDHQSGGKAYDKAGFILAYQQIAEDRLTRNFGSKERFIREEQVDVFSLNVDMVKRIKRKDLYYGLEATSNHVSSDAAIHNLETDERFYGPTRYPDGGSRMSTLAVYADINTKVNEELTLNAGLRYSHAFLASNYVDTSFYQLPFSDVQFDNGALTGSVSARYVQKDGWELGITLASGFRSPNVDDYGKVFERAGIVVVPTDELGPEYTLNADFRIIKEMEEVGLRFEGGYFYTHILEAIVQRDAQLSGVDSLLYEGSLARIAINTNAGEAFIQGWSAGFQWEVDEHWSIAGTATKTKGQEVHKSLPLAHIPPMFAKAALNRQADSWDIGAYVLYSDLKSINDMSPGRTDNADQGLEQGFPSWYTFHVQFGARISEQLHLRVNLDNLTDLNYRGFASGVTAPGRSASLTLRMLI